MTKKINFIPERLRELRKRDVFKPGDIILADFSKGKIVFNRKSRLEDAVLTIKRKEVTDAKTKSLQKG